MASNPLELELKISQQCEEEINAATTVLRIADLPFGETAPSTPPAEPWQRPTVSDSSQTSFAKYFRKYTVGLLRTLASMKLEQVEALVTDLLLARENNRQIFFLGNGGSASTASHIVTDLSKDRFGDEQFLFRALSLSENLPLMSATSNDFGYEQVFVKQLKNLLQSGDLVIAISSSGNSPNVLRALEYANQKGAVTHAIVGFGGGEASKIAQKELYIPTKAGQYGFMEDVSIVLGHIVCTFIESLDKSVAVQAATGTIRDA